MLSLSPFDELRVRFNILMVSLSNRDKLRMRKRGRERT
jgi:hypothetical protein